MYSSALECDDHRTINLMSHVIQLLLRRIMRRVRNEIKANRDEQCGFVEGRDKNDAKYIYKPPQERVIEVKHTCT